MGLGGCSKAFGAIMKESGPHKTKLKSRGAVAGGVLLTDSLCSGVSQSLSDDPSRTSRNPLTYESSSMSDIEP